MERYEYWLTILRCIGNTSKAKLIQELGKPNKIFEADRGTLLNTGAFLSKHSLDSFIEERKNYDLSSFEILKKSDINLVTINSEDYPKILREIANHPYGIFYKGKLPSDFSAAISIVGARTCTPYGHSVAEEIAFSLATAGAIIVSGMARGIDGASHMGALKAKGRTVAVLGCGVDVCYPMSHKNLYNRILEDGGCILSELAPKTPAQPMFFPARNRIISGLSKATLVIEAGIKSGSLITADFALEQGRDVYALPGRITDKLSMGTNRLISQGAGVITDKESICWEFFDMGIVKPPQKQIIYNQDLCLEKEEKLVYSCLDFNSRSMDELILKTGYSLLELMDILDSLTEKGIIVESAKNHYTLRR